MIALAAAVETWFVAITTSQWGWLVATVIATVVVVLLILRKRRN